MLRVVLSARFQKKAQRWHYVCPSSEQSREVVLHLSLDQARALDAWARHGTFQRAAQALHKGHTAVLYALRTLEDQAGIKLVDRTGYRSRLTPAGQRVLEQCRKLLATERELESLCLEMRSGWEPSLKIVFDGVFPAAPIL